MQILELNSEEFEQQLLKYKYCLLKPKNQINKKIHKVFIAVNGEIAFASLIARIAKETLIIESLYCMDFLKNTGIEAQLLDYVEKFAKENNCKGLFYQLYEWNDTAYNTEIFTSRNYKCVRDEKNDVLSFCFKKENVIATAYASTLLNAKLENENYKVSAFRDLNEMQQKQFQTLGGVDFKNYFDGFDTYLSSALILTGSGQVIGRQYNFQEGKTLQIRRMEVIPEYHGTRAVLLIVARFFQLLSNEYPDYSARYKGTKDGFMIKILKNAIDPNCCRFLNAFKVSKESI